jgi:hypothetical protein
VTSSRISQEKSNIPENAMNYNEEKNIEFSEKNFWNHADIYVFVTQIEFVIILHNTGVPNCTNTIQVTSVSFE